MTDETNRLHEADFADSDSLGAPEAIATSKWVVMKFGGTSVSSAANWKTIAERVRSRLDSGYQIVVVHSALKGVSNALGEVLQSAVSGKSSHHFDSLKQQHYDLANALGLDGPSLLDQAVQDLPGINAITF